MNTAEYNLNYARLAAIQTGIYIGVSAVMAGHALCRNVGFYGALVAIIVGSSVLCAFSMLLANLAVKSRKILIELIEVYFGRAVAQFSGLGFAIALIGWFALQLELMSHAVYFLYPSIPLLAYQFLFGSCVTISVLKGLNVIGRLANWCVPIAISIMIYTLYSIYDATTPTFPSEINFAGILMVISFSIIGVIDTPTYFVNSRIIKDAYIAIAIVYLLLLPFLAFVGVALASYTNVDDFVKGLMMLGGGIWQFFIILFIVFSGWTANNGNLYSAALAIAPVYTINNNLRILILGCVGVGIAWAGVLSNFYTFINTIIIIVIAVGGALIARFMADHFVYKPRNHKNPKIYVLILIISSLIGFLSSLDVFELGQLTFIYTFLTSLSLIFLYEIYTNAQHD